MATDRNLCTIFNISPCISGLRALSTAALMVTVLFVASLHAQDVSPHATYNFKSLERDSVHTSSIHSYQSEAQRANDALLITEVKKAIADDGVTADRAVVVDCVIHYLTQR